MGSTFTSQFHSKYKIKENILKSLILEHTHTHTHTPGVPESLAPQLMLTLLALSSAFTRGANIKHIRAHVPPPPGAF